MASDSRRRYLDRERCWYLWQSHETLSQTPSFTSQLAWPLGFRGIVPPFINYYIIVKTLRAVTPAFGRLAAVEARLEGGCRAGVGRVGRESEEVAFPDGGARERDVLTRAYLRSIQRVNPRLSRSERRVLSDTNG
ncbi:uncharacterized protein BJ212DRAFT_490098 [Suillus subaureus]|uniref:ABC transmembrane type-1 domain-containing protein n=1 Tax=Suillus subaureus TaxID=48587 RepID=A0A9P7JAZ9_9AGAM|nr:uncharacterized protein BJ212DRAFT_490098 [Suillus subaureus]KAG1811788.1 hypothetical protein BJ212DRAFT_490098 [Suillus subaureus]